MFQLCTKAGKGRDVVNTGLHVTRGQAVQAEEGAVDPQSCLCRLGEVVLQ